MFSYSKEANEEIRDDGAFLQVTLLLEDKTTFFYRTYNNILNILGDIGGLFNL